MQKGHQDSNWVCISTHILAHANLPYKDTIWTKDQSTWTRGTLDLHASCRYVTDAYVNKKNLKNFRREAATYQNRQNWVREEQK